MALHFLREVKDPVIIPTQVATQTTQYQCLSDTIVVIVKRKISEVSGCVFVCACLRVCARVCFRVCVLLVHSK